MRFLTGHSLKPRGEQHHLWKGGRVINQAGYVLRYARGHPDADPKGYLWEHRLVMEQVLGRRLERAEQVHHINGDKQDNRPENLQIMTASEHSTLHGPHRKHDSEVMRAAGRKGAAIRWGKPLPS